MRKPVIVGLAGIDKGIKALRGVGENLNERVQDIAVAIIEHANGAGNGDVSRALTLCQAVKRLRTLNVAYVVGFFRYFGNCNVNLNDAKVSLLAKDSKAYRGGFDPVGAKANKWYDAVNDEGEKAPWYAGPLPPEFKPYTIGDEAQRIANFVKGERKRLDDTKTVNGEEVPLVALTEADREQMLNALTFMERIANTLARHEDVQRKAAELAAAEAGVNDDEEVVAVIQPKEAAVG